MTPLLSICCPFAVQPASNTCPTAVHWLSNLRPISRSGDGPRGWPTSRPGLGLAAAPYSRNLRHTGERHPTWAKHAMNTFPEARTGPGFPARRQPA